MKGCSIGLYRENAIAIESEARDPFGGNVYYVTMQITFPIPKFARKESNLHCDVVHVTTKLVSKTRSGSPDRSDLDVAIKAYTKRSTIIKWLYMPYYPWYIIIIN